MPDLQQNPIPREVRSFIRYNEKRKRKYIWLICNECKKGHWVDLWYFKHKFKSNLCISCKRKIRLQGEHNPSWKGGRHIDKHGYVLLYVKPDNPYHCMCIKGKNYVKEHRYVMAKELGRPLYQWEVVHHKDANRINNKPSNLKLYGSQGDHIPSMVVQNYIKRLEDKIKKLENM